MDSLEQNGGLAGREFGENNAEGTSINQIVLVSSLHTSLVHSTWLVPNLYLYLIKGEEGQEGEEEDDDPYDDADGDYDMDNADEMNAEADMAGEAPSPNDD